MKTIIACDFDGTITEEDVCDEIMTEFSTINWRVIGERYLEGEISYQEMNKRFISSIIVTPEQLDVFLHQRIQIRSGFNRLLKQCDVRDIRLVILSCGWDYYIKRILTDIELNFPTSQQELIISSRNQISVICNHIHYNGDNNWNISFPYLSKSTECTPDKQKIVESVRASGFQNIIIIGDSFTDHGMTRVANKVFARDSLIDFCKVHNIPFESFADFNEVSDKLFKE